MTMVRLPGTPAPGPAGQVTPGLDGRATCGPPAGEEVAMPAWDARYVCDP